MIQSEERPDSPATLARIFAYVAGPLGACLLLFDTIAWLGHLPRIPGNAHDILMVIIGVPAAIAVLLWAQGHRQRQVLTLVDDRAEQERRGYERGRAEGYEEGYNQGWLEGAASRAPRDVSTQGHARVRQIRAGNDH